MIAGYAGWAPGQLDNELARGDWHVVEADEDSVFSDRPAEVWDLALPPEPTRQALLGSAERIRSEVVPLEAAGTLAAFQVPPVMCVGAGEDAEADEGVVVLVAQFDAGSGPPLRLETHTSDAVVELATDAGGRHLVGQLGLGGR